MGEVGKRSFMKGLGKDCSGLDSRCSEAKEHFMEGSEVA